jgi:hypothetical protein
MKNFSYENKGMKSHTHNQYIANKKEDVSFFPIRPLFIYLFISALYRLRRRLQGSSLPQRKPYCNHPQSSVSNSLPQPQIRLLVEAQNRS